MKNNLQLLIEHLEAEKLYLENELNLNVEEKDFEAAQHFSKALGIVNGKLRVLASLDNTNRLKIQQGKESLEWMKKKFSQLKIKTSLRLNAESQARMEVYWEQLNNNRLDVLKERIEQLESEPKRKHLDQDIIDDAIYSLASGEIKSFRINLIKSRSFYLSFTKASSESLLIQVANEPNMKSNDWMSKHFVDQLIRLGFEKKNNDLQIEIDNCSDTVEIKKLLSRIVFDVYSSINFNEEITIEIQQ